MSLAKTWKPASASSTEISRYSGMFVASASTLTLFSSVTVIASDLDSPMTWIGMSTVTFSPFFTSTKSMCSRKPLIGSAWICLVSARCVVPSMSR